MTAPVRCPCEPGATPQVFETEEPGRIYRWAVECPYCGRGAPWCKTEAGAVRAWHRKYYGQPVVPKRGGDHAE